MPAGSTSAVAIPAPDDKDVFLNIPFDSRYQPLFVALLAGLTALGRTPHCVLEVPASANRLERIVGLMGRCGASVHDLSRVALSHAGGFRVPRFNMPFELGLAYMVARQAPHALFVFESEPHRLQVSLSDLNGHDPHVHGATQTGILGCVLDCFGSPAGPPPLATLRGLARRLGVAVQNLQREQNQRSPFTANIFRQAVRAAAEMARAEGLLQA